MKSKACKRKKTKVLHAVYATIEQSNLENYIAGYNKSGFVAYPDPETDELLNAYLRGYNLGIVG